MFIYIKPKPFLFENDITPLEDEPPEENQDKTNTATRFDQNQRC